MRRVPGPVKTTCCMSYLRLDEPLLYAEYAIGVAPGQGLSRLIRDMGGRVRGIIRAMSTASKPAGTISDGRVTARLISRIKSMIADGTLTPGTKFPPERDLAIKFSVNRTSVRQALKVLEIMGMLTQRVGDGTYLSNSAETILSEPLDSWCCWMTCRTTSFRDALDRGTRIDRACHAKGHY